MSELRYSRQQISEADIKAVVRVLRSDWLTQGPEVEAFEADLCAYTGARYCVVVGSGTAALQLAYLVARKARLHTSPLTFVATANAAVMNRMDVKFQDVDPQTGNATLPGFHDCLSVPVHFAGRAAWIPETGVVIEDASHALGALCYLGCCHVGSASHSLAAVLSFHAVKPICCGEGGAVLTNVEGFAEEVRELRSHGRVNGSMERLGINARMTEMQAALGRSQLRRCEDMRERREELSLMYHTALKPMEFEGWLKRPYQGGPPSAWHLYTIRIPHGRRDAVKTSLNAQGISATVHYPSVHLEPFYRTKFEFRDGDYPEAEAWSRETLSLPLHSGMSDADVTRVVDALRKELAA